MAESKWYTHAEAAQIKADSLAMAADEAARDADGLFRANGKLRDGTYEKHMTPEYGAICMAAELRAGRLARATQHLERMEAHRELIAAIGNIELSTWDGT